MASQNLIEKITQRHAVGLEVGFRVGSGDFLSIRPAHVMTHDNTGAVIPKFKAIGSDCVSDRRQIVITLDHDIQNRSEKNLEKYSSIEAFARRHRIDFYPAGRGIGHQIMCEEGYAWPGTMVVASDSHSNMYGGLGCLGTPVVRTDAAAIWATGRTWWQVPPVARVELRGVLRQGVSGKDVIIALCGFFNEDQVLNHAIEFTGDGVTSISVDQRLTIANMTTEWGALAGVFPVDGLTLAWLRERALFVNERGSAGVASDEDADGNNPRLTHNRIDELEQCLPAADSDARYAIDISIDLDSIEPHVSGPNSVKIMTPLSEIRKKRIRIDKAYLVSCVNSRVEDLAAAAEVVRGKKVAGHVEFYVAPASSEVQKQSEDRGDWQALLEAGAVPLPAGCGPCIGLGAGILEDGEVGISATNRNFRGRMGSRDAEAFLSSPAVVAASACAGYIDGPGGSGTGSISGRVRVHKSSDQQMKHVEILPGFPGMIEGELVFCHQDNLNTDGIFPGKYTYRDDFTPEEQAEVVMENYDPEFAKTVRDGDILVGGFNFGTGSSREQAATALKHRGIRLVLAGSFSETYKRNALNNGFLVLEVPRLVEELSAELGVSKPTVRTGLEARIDFGHSLLTAGGKTYRLKPVGAVAQELVVAGGLECWVRRQLEHA